jgi:hypothetical protein
MLLGRNKEVDDAEVENGEIRRGDGYILQLKSVLKLRKQILLDSVDEIINLPARTGRLDAVLDMCDELLWIERDSEQARKHGWWDSMKETERATN